MVQDAIKVQLLGGFSVSYGDVTVLQGSGRSKEKLLLAYLLYHHDRMAPQSELLDLLGHDERVEDPARALRIVLWRARKALEALDWPGDHRFLITKGGYTGWNEEIPLELDTERFEALCKEGESAESRDRKLDACLEALDIYGGELLPVFSGEGWVQPASAYYQQRYVWVNQAALPLLRDAGRHSEAEAICRRAVKESPYEEGLYRQLIRTLMAQEKFDEAAETYRSLRELLLNNLGITPDEDSQSLYQEILTRVGDRYLPTDVIRSQLREENTPDGALICDFPIFRMFYQAEARSADRRGDAVHLGVLTVEGKKDHLTSSALERAMNQLREQIHGVLRVGDVAARCSASQFVVLLVQANYENSQMVCTRVTRSFARQHPRSPAKVRISVLPIEPPSPTEQEQDTGFHTW